MPVPVGVAIGGWALMSVAMMVPVTLPALRHVGLNSIRRRRWWAMAVYVASYLAGWVLFGVLALTLVWALRSTGLGDRQLLVGALVIATGWQLTRWKRRAVLACQRTVPLPPTGWRADYGCAHFGIRQAGRCVISCWPLMLLMAVLGHGSLLVMAALTAGIVAERRASAGRRLIALLGGALAVATVWTVLLG
jgi:predicted metal-binding membrane protein